MRTYSHDLRIMRSHNAKTTWTKISEGAFAKRQPRMRRSSPDLNFKPRQNVGKLPKPIPPYISLEWARVENKTRIPSVLNSAAPVSPQRCWGLGKCSAVTSPSDSSSTQPGLGASPKHSLRPSVCMGMGEAFFHGPLLLPINASTTTRYDQCWLHGYHSCLAVIEPQTPWDVHYFGASHKWTRRTELDTILNHSIPSLQLFMIAVNIILTYAAC
jgi:hypothetical protein